MGKRELDRVRQIVLTLPGVNERLSHGAVCFFVRDKRPVCYFHDHHNDDRVSLWCPAPPGVQEDLVAAQPHRFFKPPTSAKGTFSEWLGVYLDTSADSVDWDEIAAIVEEAFRIVASKQPLPNSTSERLPQIGNPAVLLFRRWRAAPRCPPPVDPQRQGGRAGS